MWIADRGPPSTCCCRLCAVGYDDWEVTFAALIAVVLLASAQNGDVLKDAAAAYAAGDTATAIRLYREFLKSYPDAAEIRSNLAAALVQAGQFDEAVKEYHAALKQLPNNAFFFYRNSYAWWYYAGRLSGVRG